MPEREQGLSLLGERLRLLCRGETNAVPQSDGYRQTRRKGVFSQVDMAQGIAGKLGNDSVIANVVGCACHTFLPF